MGSRRTTSPRTGTSKALPYWVLRTTSYPDPREHSRRKHRRRSTGALSSSVEVERRPIIRGAGLQVSIRRRTKYEVVLRCLASGADCALLPHQIANEGVA